MTDRTLHPWQERISSIVAGDNDCFSSGNSCDDLDILTLLGGFIGSVAGAFPS